MYKIINPDLLKKSRPKVAFPRKFDFETHIRLREAESGTVAEFIGAGNFASNFYERQQYEVDAGRDEVPLLYTTIYDPIIDANLPETININTLGPSGVVLEQVQPGGEAKFASVAESSKTVTMLQYAVALAYTKKLFMFNQSWNFPILERRFGQAYNALLNHIHLSPILTASYGASNQTAAVASGSTVWENVMLTVENAITHAMTDTTNPRRGSYDLLISGGDQFKVERALKLRIQNGIDEQTSAVGMLDNIIIYNGWSGTRGKKATTYAGVTSGKAYLVSKQYRDEDFRSYVKQALQSQRGDGDLTRFIVEQVVYDTWFGVFADPTKAVEEITLPT